MCNLGYFRPVQRDATGENNPAKRHCDRQPLLNSERVGSRAVNCFAQLAEQRRCWQRQDDGQGGESIIGSLVGVPWDLLYHLTGSHGKQQ